MYQMEKNTAEKRAATREAMTWKSRANATIRRVHSHFGDFPLEVLLAWPADNARGARGDNAEPEAAEDVSFLG
jgi:hypothetical protein